MNKKNAEISARIGETICLLHTNPNKFANALGYGRSQTIYDILNGKSAPSYDFFNRFCNSGYSVFIDLRWLLTGEGSPIIEETYYQSDLPVVKGEMTAEEAKKKLEEIRLNKQDSIAAKGNSELISIVREQAEEIGRLKARIEELERRRGDNAGHAQSSDIANVG